MTETKLPWINTRRQALILAGGGIRMAYQSGCLLALEQAGLAFQHVDGTSGGIFNAAMLASGLDASEMSNRWRTLKVKRFLSLRPLLAYLRPFRLSGATDADGIRHSVFPHLGIDTSRIRTNRAFESTFNVCNFSSKTLESIPGPEVREDHLIAGVSLAMIMPALQIDGAWYTDAVWLKDANLLEAVKRGAEDLWMIWAIGNAPAYYAGALNQYVHMLEMSANGALWEEFQQIRMINEDRLTYPAPVRLYIIKPKYPLPLDPDLFFDRIDTRSLINMGYADACRALATMPETGQAMDSHATRMNAPGDRLCFRMTFANQLAWQGRTAEVIHYSYFRYTEKPDYQELEVFSSICLAGEEIPLAAHFIQLNATTIQIQAQLLYHDQSLKVIVNMDKPFPSDVLLGLAFKRMELVVCREDEILLSGTLYQSIRQRFKGALKTHVRTKEGFAGSQRKKYQMIKNLIAYEI